MFSSKPLRSALIATTAAMVLVGVSTSAIWAHGGDGGLVHGCIDGVTRVVRVVAPADACYPTETGLDWGITGPQGPQGMQGLQGPRGPSDAYMNRNYQDVPLASFPGVTVAKLQLPKGDYVLTAKLRLRNASAISMVDATCVYQGDGIGGLDGTEAVLAPVGAGAQSEETLVLLDMVRKTSSETPEVRVQCFGPKDAHVINTQFVAVQVGSLQLQ